MLLGHNTNHKHSHSLSIRRISTIRAAALTTKATRMDSMIHVGTTHLSASRTLALLQLLWWLLLQPQFITTTISQLQLTTITSSSLLKLQLLTTTTMLQLPHSHSIRIGPPQHLTDSNLQASFSWTELPMVSATLSTRFKSSILRASLHVCDRVCERMCEITECLKSPFSLLLRMIKNSSLPLRPAHVLFVYVVE